MNYLNTNTPYVLFEKTLKNEIYVDKSLFIEKISEHINTGNCYICVTRPRRFGKTINASMLGAYYTKECSGDKLFKDLEISQSDNFELHLNNHNVIYIDFSRMPDGCNNFQDYLNDIIRGIREDIENSYAHIKEKEYTRLSQLLIATGDSFIFIFDEWDSIFYQKFMTIQDKDAYLSFLKGLLKDQPYVELAYMTGILPITKYSSESELNMFDEFNFMNDNVYDDYFGFTESEVKQLCASYGKPSFAEIQMWYDGYYKSNGERLFNPRSVSKALMRGICLNYWTETGPMNEIADCIEHNIDAVKEDIVKMLSGIRVEIELLGYSASESQLNTREEILSAMVVYGFLSYYDGYLTIPNYELMEKYQRVVSRDSMGDVKEIVDLSKEMLLATLEQKEEKVAEILENVHDREIPFLQYGDENSLSCVITLCYLYARKDYYIEREAKSGKGYCDYLFIPKKSDKPAIILELKVGKSPQEAIEQIKNKNYIQKVSNCKTVLLVGINYDEQKHHECMIEKIEK